MSSETWEESVEACKRDGGKLHTPNGLPVMCIRYDNLMLECEHGDHPDYIFPVTAKLIGEPEMMDGYPVEGDELHALIYHDDSIALTLHECSYFVWHLRDGKLIRSPFNDKDRWQLDAADVQKIRERSAARALIEKTRKKPRWFVRRTR